MADKIQAVVIKANDRKEKDKNILLFSIERGKEWATLRGVKGANAKMKMAQSPFCFGEFVLEDGKAGKIVTSFEIIESFYELSQNIDHYFEASAILEVVNALEFSSQNERTQIFVLLLKALKTICFSNVKPNYVLCKFFIELFKLSGVPIYSEKCHCCGAKAVERIYINFSVGELVCINCKSLNSQELSKICYLALKFLSNVEFERLQTLNLAQNSEMELLKILVKNFEVRFDKRLKMLGVLS